MYSIYVKFFEHWVALSLSISLWMPRICAYAVCKESECRLVRKFHKFQILNCELSIYWKDIFEKCFVSSTFLFALVILRHH